MGYFDKPIQGFDYLPWTDSETRFLWDCKFASCSSEEQKDAIRYPYAWVLVHSRIPKDIHRGMDMLRAADSLKRTNINPKQKKKEMYLLAVGQFRCRGYSRSETLVDRCLEITPNCWKSLFLKELITYRYTKERKPSSIFIDSPVTSVEFVTSVLAAAPRTSHPTWGIEKVPKWTHSITNKKAIQHALEEDLLYVCLVSVVAFGFGLAAVLFRSK